MAKDPAVLFYTNDFLSRTFTMSDEQVGKYIRLLCIQHQQGYLTEQDMLNICKTYDVAVYSKFTKEGDMFFNERMRSETEKRKNYSESRRNNRKTTKDKNICKTYDKHMENRDIDVNEIVLNEEMQKLWASTFGRNPKIPEIELTQELIDRFGYDKVYQIFKRATLDGFNKLTTLIEALDESGNIKPKQSGKVSPRGSIDFDKYRKELEQAYPDRT